MLAVSVYKSDCRGNVALYNKEKTNLWFLKSEKNVPKIINHFTHLKESKSWTSTLIFQSIEEILKLNLQINRFCKVWNIVQQLCTYRYDKYKLWLKLQFSSAYLVSRCNCVFKPRLSDHDEQTDANDCKQD